MKTIHIGGFEEFTIIVDEMDDGKYDVYLLYETARHLSSRIDIELCANKIQALKGAERFPKLYKIAKEEGFYVDQHAFVHKEHRNIDLDYSYSMDLDMTEQLFRSCLLKAKHSIDV